MSPVLPTDLVGFYPGQRLIEVTVNKFGNEPKLALLVHAEIGGRSKGRAPFGSRFPGPDSVMVEAKLLYPARL